MRIKLITSRPAPASVRDLLSRMVRGRGPTEPVQRREIPYWQERGWNQSGNTYNGTYQTRYAAFWGEIIEHSATDIDFFLYQPSDEIRRCGHWACFQHRGSDWYLVHMGRRPKDVSSGMLAIERLITEAYES
ncbi:MAG: hypothetical protein HY040_26265 [Planctomycetes bacterium]|nr:hypothetical protein [Planctomycetota bacterium]